MIMEVSPTNKQTDSQTDHLLDNIYFNIYNAIPKYTFEEVLSSSIVYFKGDELAASTFATKYALSDPLFRGDAKYIELTPTDMHNRICAQLARIDCLYKHGKDSFVKVATQDKIYSNDEVYVTWLHFFNLYKLYIDNFNYVVPQGSPMFGIGNRFADVSLSNCIVIDSPRDSMSGIMDSAKELANLMKRRAGVGLDVTSLRPEATPTKTSSGTSTGAWAWSNHFSNTTRETAQNGRRGALMITLGILHPDSDRFTTMKLDKTYCTGANVSLRVDDEFMNMVEEDNYAYLRFPENLDYQKIIEDNSSLGKWVEKEEVVDLEGNILKLKSEYFDAPGLSYKNVIRRVRAKDLWMLINDCARKSAEPGIIFWDNYFKNLPACCYSKFKSISVNPCVTGDTWILTSKGPRQATDLLDTQFNAIIDGKEHQSSRRGFFKTGEKDVWEVTTFEGHRFKATSDHLVCVVEATRNTRKESWKPLSELAIGTKLSLSNNLNFSWDGNGSRDEGWLIGNLLGDGNITKQGTAYLDYWGENQDQMLADAASLIHATVGARSDCVGSSSLKYNRSRIGSSKLAILASQYGLNNESKSLNYQAETASSEFWGGLISGWIDADGTIAVGTNKGQSLRISSVNISNLEMAQLALAHMGINSCIYKNRRQEGYRLLPDGNDGLKSYYCQSLHELHIAKDNLQKLSSILTLKDPQKQDALSKALNSYKRKPNRDRFIARVQSINYIGAEAVYDCTVPSVSCFSGNAIKLHNCAEIALAPYDSCRLVSLNLKSLVKNAFHSDLAYFDTDKWKEVVGIGMRIMDNILDLEIEALEKIINSVEEKDEKLLWSKLLDMATEGRRTGLGTHALGDALASECIAYGSEKSFERVDEIYRILRDEAYNTSADLAIERGAFPAFDWELEKDNEFIQRLPDYIKEKIAKTGRRNISILTNAPTGSVSIISQTSSGIEPWFMMAYTRRKKINPSDEVSRVDFVDQNKDKWQEFMVFHHSVREYINSHDDIKKQWEQTQADTPSSQWATKLKAIMPEYFVSASEIDPTMRVKLQGILQKYIDHGVSSTINLPKGTTTQTIANIYYTAWKEGLKGVTVYVDGSRSGVLVSTGSGTSGRDGSSIVETDAPRRPKELSCDIHRASVEGQYWTIVVGKLNDKPYEIFGGKSEQVEIPRRKDKGRIVKRKVDTENKTSTVYDLLIGDDDDDQLVIRDIGQTFHNPEYAWATRQLSLQLRHGISPKFIVQQLRRANNCALTHFSKAIARVLAKYVNEEGESDLNENGIFCKSGSCE